MYIPIAIENPTQCGHTTATPTESAPWTYPALTATRTNTNSLNWLQHLGAEQQSLWNLLLILTEETSYKTHYIALITQSREWCY